MTINLPSFDQSLIPSLAWLLAGLLLWLWLRRELTPARVVSLLESEKSLSLRLLLACVVVVYTLNMQAAGRLSDTAVAANWTFAGSLLALGVAKVVSKAFAAAPPAPGPTTVQARKAEVTAAGDVNFQPPTTSE